MMQVNIDVNGDVNDGQKSSFSVKCNVNNDVSK